LIAGFPPKNKNHVTRFYELPHTASEALKNTWLAMRENEVKNRNALLVATRSGRLLGIPAIDGSGVEEAAAAPKAVCARQRWVLFDAGKVWLQ
jgi:hypothetical protein